MTESDRIGAAIEFCKAQEAVAAIRAAERYARIGAAIEFRKAQEAAAAKRAAERRARIDAALAKLPKGKRK